LDEVPMRIAARTPSGNNGSDTCATSFA